MSSWTRAQTESSTGQRVVATGTVTAVTWSQAEGRAVERTCTVRVWDDGTGWNRTMGRAATETEVQAVLTAQGA